MKKRVLFFVILLCLILGSMLACTEKESTEPIVSTSEQPYDTTPIDSTLFDGVLIHALHGTGNKGAEAVIACGFVQLYNETDSAIALDGASLYYKTDNGNTYVEFPLPKEASIPAKGYYLIRGDEVAGFRAENEILRITDADAHWGTLFDNKEITMILAPSHRHFDHTASPDEIEDINSIFVATESPRGYHFEVTDLSRNKIAIRTAKTAYSGYHLVNLTKRATAELEAILPQNAKGVKSEVVASRLDEVRFSHSAGFYDEGITLTLSANSAYTIYYTLDGSDPTVQTNPARRLYQAPLVLQDTEKMPWGLTIRKWNALHSAAFPMNTSLPGAHVIKAYATDGANATAVFTNTYFIATHMESYHLPVMSFSIPVDDIVGKNGFYSHFAPSGDPNDPRARGTGVMEVFDESGKRVGYSTIEAAISGNGGSAYYAMKPLRLYFKGSLNESGGGFSSLDYDLFAGLAKDAKGNPITSFDRLLLRNSGNDCGVSYIRDAYMQRVSSGLAVDGLASRSVFLFINGEFWGVYNARERYSSEYVASHYGVAKENVAILENDYRLVYTDPNAPYVATTDDPADADDFNELVDFIRQNSMANNKNYEIVKSRMDIDSLIDLWVVRLYFNATDWPNNNVKVFRNKNPRDPSGMDTKWRFALHDLDLGMLEMDHLHYTQNIFYAFDTSSVCTTIMVRLLENVLFRRQFLTRYYTLVNEFFTPDYLLAEYEALYQERIAIMPLQEARWGREGASVERFQEASDYIRRFVQERNAYALEALYSYFGVNETRIKEMILHQKYW